MKTHQIWATIVGLVSLTIGILAFFITSLGQTIPPLDRIIHIITGILFLAGAWWQMGKYVRKTNLLLGLFYIVFGAVGFNLPHIILGIISSVLGLVIKTTKNIKGIDK